jgi:hypothetical protein
MAADAPPTQCEGVLYPGVPGKQKRCPRTDKLAPARFRNLGERYLCPAHQYTYTKIRTMSLWPREESKVSRERSGRRV